MLPRSLSGQGRALLHCTPEADARFRFSDIPAKWPELQPWLDSSPDDLSSAGHHHATDRYRIAIPEKWSSGAWAKVRFGLSKGTPKKTLEVIAQHLNEERIDWLYFTNDDGTRLKGARFTVCHTRSAA